MSMCNDCDELLGSLNDYTEGLLWKLDGFRIDLGYYFLVMLVFPLR